MLLLCRTSLHCMSAAILDFCKSLAVQWAVPENPTLNQTSRWSDSQTGCEVITIFVYSIQGDSYHLGFLETENCTIISVDPENTAVED